MQCSKNFIEMRRGGQKGRGMGKGREGNRGRGQSNYNRKSQDEEGSQTQQRCDICKSSSHMQKDCWFKGKPQCHNCKNFGRLKKDCKNKNNQQASVAHEKKMR